MTITEAERIIKESDNKEEAIAKLHNLPIRQSKPEPPNGGITIQAAHRKYKMHTSTLSRWGQKGLVPVLLRTKNETYLDEAILAKIVEAYNQSPGQGKWTIKQIVNAS